MPLDTLITGRIATLKGDAGFGWVEAIGIRDGRVAFAGTEVDLETRADPFTVRIRLEPDQVAIPGLTDAHLHLVQAAMATRQVDLSDAPSLEDGLRRLRAAHEALPPDAWLEGHGWDSDRWGRWPTADDLETVAPGRRAAIWAHDHHAMWVSHAALEVSTMPEGDPPGGLVRRDAAGRPEGVLYEAATRLVTIHIPPMSPDDLDRALVQVGHDLASLGVVACHDPGGVAPDPDLTYSYPAYARLADAGRLPVRVHACMRDDAVAAAVEQGSSQRQAARRRSRWPGDRRLAEVLRRRLAGITDRGTARGHRAGTRSAVGARPPTRRVDDRAGRPARARRAGGGRRDRDDDPRDR